MQIPLPKPNVQRTFGEVTYFGCATGDICMLDWASGSTRCNSMHKEGYPVQALAFSEDFVYSGGWDRRIYRYSRTDLEFDQNCLFYASDNEPWAHTDYVKSLCVSGDNKVLYSGSADGYVHRWELPPRGCGQTYLKPVQQRLFNRFVNTISMLNEQQIICGGSNHTLYILDAETLAVVREVPLANTSNIRRVIVRGALIFVLSRDILVLDAQFTPQRLFILKAEPVDVYFPPATPELFYAACEDGIKKIRFDQAAPLDYYERLGANGRAWTEDMVRQLFKTDFVDNYETVPSGLTAPPCGLECVKQHISWNGVERDCYMLIYGSADEFARRIFFFSEDREAFIQKEAEQSSVSDFSELEKMEIDAKKMEEIKYKRLGAMLQGSETWHKDTFDDE